jgi:hypothetical protein
VAWVVLFPFVLCVSAGKATDGVVVVVMVERWRGGWWVAEARRPLYLFSIHMLQEPKLPGTEQHPPAMMMPQQRIE